MNWTALSVAVALSLLTGVVCYFWGKRVQQSQSQTEWQLQLEKVQEAEKAATERVASKLRELSIKQQEFDNLPWDKRLELLGLKEWVL